MKQIVKGSKPLVIEAGICSLLVIFIFSVPYIRGEYELMSFILGWLIAHLGPLYPMVLTLFYSWGEASMLGSIIWMGVALLLISPVIRYLTRPSFLAYVGSFLGIIIWFLIGLLSLLMGYT